MRWLPRWRPFATYGPQKVGRLLLLAGASCSGKSRLIDSLLSDPPPAMVELMGTEPWTCTSAMRLRTIADSRVERLLLHVDTTVCSHRHEGPARYAEYSPLGVVRRAERIDVVTVWAPASVLEQRVQARLAAGILDMTKARHRNRLDYLTRLYRDSQAFDEHYRQWATFVEGLDATSHWWVDSGDTPARITPVQTVKS